MHEYHPINEGYLDMVTLTQLLKLNRLAQLQATIPMDLLLY